VKWLQSLFSRHNTEEINMRRILIPIFLLLSCRKETNSPAADLSSNLPIHVALQFPQKSSDLIEEAPTVSYFTNAIILCAGNSLTLGGYLPANENYPAQLQKNRLFDSALVVNKGIDGMTTELMLARMTIDIQPYYKPERRNILVAWEIGNDIYRYGTKDSAAFGLFADYCASLRQKGWQVIAVTLPYRNNDYFTNSLLTPGGDDSVQYANKCAVVNNLMRSEWKSFSDGLADLAQEKALSAYNPTFYRPDHLHLTADGYAIVEKIIFDKIVEINTRKIKKPI
jgi:lysophospholipase L1-like esterase